MKAAIAAFVLAVAPLSAFAEAISLRLETSRNGELVEKMEMVVTSRQPTRFDIGTTNVTLFFEDRGEGVLATGKIEGPTLPARPVQIYSGYGERGVLQLHDAQGDVLRIAFIPESKRLPSIPGGALRLPER